MTSTLHVVTHRRWVADDLAATAPGNVTVRHSLGLDLPVIAPGDAVWAPMEWLARARAQVGPRVLPLADPGAMFLDLLPQESLGRPVGFATYAAVTAGAGPDAGFYKPANCKVETFPAAWRTRAQVIADAAAAGLADETVLMWTPSRLEFVEEHRVFVRAGRAVTSSPYLIRGTLWHERMSSSLTREAERFAQRVVDAVAVPLPPAFVLDVGLVRTGRLARDWVVIEANPAWSSAQYGADLGVVIGCLFDANRVHAPGWEWAPDPHLLARVAQQRPLPVQATLR